MASGRSLPEKKVRWDVLLGNAKQYLTGVAHMQPDLKELDRIARELDKLTAEKAKLLGQSQAITAKIRELARQGDRVRGRLGAALKGHYGFDAERLIAFGFRPRRTKRRGGLDEATERRLRGEGAGQGEEGEGGRAG